MLKKLRLWLNRRKYTHDLLCSMLDKVDEDYIKTANYHKNAERECRLYDQIKDALPAEYHSVLLRYSDAVNMLIVDHAEYFYFRGLWKSNIFKRGLFEIVKTYMDGYWRGHTIAVLYFIYNYLYNLKYYSMNDKISIKYILKGNAMTLHLNPKIGIIIFIIIMVQSVIFINYLLIKGRKTIVLYSHVACHILSALWIFFAMIETLTKGNSEYYWLAIRLAFFPLCFFGAAWMIFCLAYTENKLLHNKYLVGSLITISVFFYSVVLTNEKHHLFIKAFSVGTTYRIYGSIFWMLMIQIYLCFLTGIIMFIYYSVKHAKKLEKKYILLIGAAVLPLIVNILTSTKIIDIWGFDITPVTFAITLTLCAVAIFKYRLLDIIPMALKEIIFSMKEAVLVIDNFQWIVDFNNSFYEVFGNYIDSEKKENVNAFLEKLKEISKDAVKIDKMMEILKSESTGYFEDEINLSDWKDSTYFVYIKSVHDKKNKIIGKIISFNDITSYKTLLKDLNEKNEEVTAMNEELIAANDQLREYSETVEELAVAKERNRFARDAHDSLGHSITILISQLELCDRCFDTSTDEARLKLSEAMNTAKSTMNELRQSISGIAGRSLGKVGVVEAIKKLTDAFTATGLNVELTVQGKENNVDSEHAEAIYRVCQEGMTNALRHGKAKNVNIIIKFETGRIRIFIVDDGIGCTGIKKGLGLKGMEQRAEALNGMVSYGSDGEKGFIVTVELPVN